MNEKLPFVFVIAFPVVLLVSGLMLEPLPVIGEGLLAIISAPSVLLTDYLAVGGVGATLVNAGILGIASVVLIYGCKAQINGPFIAAVYTVVGFAFFGKNIYNVVPILVGAWLYSAHQGVQYRNVLLIALFGTTLGPLVSFLTVATGLAPNVAITIAIMFGLLAGFVLPPLASHMLRFHDGYNIYNVGFTGGITGAFFVAVFRSFDFEIGATSVLTGEYHAFFMQFFVVMFLFLIALSVFMSRLDYGALFSALRRIYASGGRLVSDFVQIGNFSGAIMNMGVMGLASILFVIILGGELNGPVIGGILTVVGFAAFGKHLFNCVPVVLGVVIASLVTAWNTTTTPVVIAGLFGTTLAPVAGQYGVVAGIAAGFFHLSIVMNVGILHGGVNLYNNGFAGGFVASFLVPVLDALRRPRSNRT